MIIHNLWLTSPKISTNCEHIAQIYRPDLTLFATLVLQGFRLFCIFHFWDALCEVSEIYMFSECCKWSICRRWCTPSENIQCIKNAEIVKISLAHTGGILISWKILNPLICCFIVSRFLLKWPLFGVFGCEKPQRSQYRSFLAKHFQFFWEAVTQTENIFSI